VNSLLQSDSNLCNDQTGRICFIDDNNEYAQTCLDAVMEAVLKDDEQNEICGETTSYKTTEGNVVFLSQENHIIIAIQHFPIIISRNLSGLSNFRTKQNWKTNLINILRM
jgi:hypothetical protein